MKHSLFTAKQSNGSRTGHVKNQFFASEGRHHSMVRRQMRLLNGGGRIDQIHQPEAKARNPIFHIHGAFLVPGHEFPCREQHTHFSNYRRSRTNLFFTVLPPERACELDGLEATSVLMANGPQRLFSTSMSNTDTRCYIVFTRCLSRWKRSVSVSLYPW